MRIINVQICRLLLLLLVMAGVCPGQTDSIIVTMENGTVYRYAVPDIREILVTGRTSGFSEEMLVQSVLKSFKLLQNYPNPFNPATTIQYEIPSDGAVEVNIYDIQGRLIRSFGPEEQKSGVHRQYWDGRDNSGIPVSSGSYFCRLQFNNDYLTNKLLLIK